jgi:hypothetical protein
MDEEFINIICVYKNTKQTKKCVKRCMYKDNYQMIVPNLNEKSFMIVHTNKTGEWESFLHCYVDNSVLTFATGFTRKENRRQGLSTKLRQYALKLNKKIKKYESLTMPDSNSDTLLEKIGFTKEGCKMVKYSDKQGDNNKH